MLPDYPSIILIAAGASEFLLIRALVRTPCKQVILVRDLWKATSRIRSAHTFGGHVPQFLGTLPPMLRGIYLDRVHATHLQWSPPVLDFALNRRP
jgi:hypothetical protein